MVDWSPDGDRLVMAARVAGTGRWHLFVTDAAGRAPVQITTRDGLFLDPSWSPNGAQITYTAFPPGAVGFGLDQLEIYVADANGGNETRLTNDNLRDHDPYWSPDGTTIAYEAAVDPTFVGVGKWALRTVPATGGATPTTVLDDGHINTLPRWSEDGQTLLFHRFLFGGGTGFVLASVAPDGSNLAAITTGGGYDDSDVDWYRSPR